MLTTEQQEQFTQLWTQAQSTVACFVQTSIRDRGQAEDLLQEIAMTLLRKFSDYDPSKAFLPWAMGVAKFAILGSRRDCARSRLVFDEALLERISNTFLEIAPAQREEAAFLDVCLTKLAPKSRQMVRLRYYDSLDLREIARTLGKSEVAIRVGLLRIREQLRKCIENQILLERSHP
jgi:RNA polymerase sigma-70 factor (ECF subfamily)